LPCNIYKQIDISSRKKIIIDFLSKYIYLGIYHLEEIKMISTAKIFINGRSQAVRLPKEYRFETKEVYINKIDGIVMIIPKEKRMEILEKSLEKFTDDYMNVRNQPENQLRENV